MSSITTALSFKIVFSIWKGLRKKRSDKKKGVAELMRHVSMSFTKLLHFLDQKWEKSNFDKKIIR